MPFRTASVQEQRPAISAMRVGRDNRRRKGDN